MLAGRVAVVTGASKGIGRAIALELAEGGADLVINARGQAALDAVAAEIRARGREVEAVPADVATEAGARLVVERAVARFGGIDVLVNNAGKGAPKRLLDLTEEDWRASLELNLMAAVRLSLACVPLMRARGGGRIINIASRVGRQPDPLFAPYAAAKAALINFTKSLANAFSKDGILSNCVVPGLIRTEAVEEAARQSAAATGKTVEEVFAETLRRRPIPAGRMGEPADVAGLVVFLASPRASWITGSTFTVDGGIVPTVP
ncbi:MAG TPA: glucose 1-dehydrogenase [Candidatus Limnocylindria bacterium]|jgi:3-oxoacyl-[acyl-carrier protein] reductase|nr:glucose 1-dehydrogenase [Candidatus Limnocylindria bacterium]